MKPQKRTAPAPLTLHGPKKEDKDEPGFKPQYILLWWLAVPYPLFILIYLLRGCS